ncbi:hypothetical protein [Paenibacillus polymyxa]|uniref:Nucleotidyl transferase AbiEii/AbiGii toxin family protein n=1 Tax=Paenibacillus polymyxa TaxID=1406 RepID=A0ABX2ZAD7_PAEPO|nr:hypothetical protein [Paenibacillus polymyxa]ODA08243.1 hypothetical protein A7312_27950 [Paenibacillus polymyxa]
MNIRSIKRKLQEAHRSFIASIKNEEIAKLVNEKSFITGGAIVSLLLEEDPNDYDYYFMDQESCIQVAEYYVNKFNRSTNDTYGATVKKIEDRVSVFVPSQGVAKAKYKEGFNPVFLSTNAITLSDNVQLITRFYGDPEEVHENYDFVHCTCYYIPHKNELVLPQKALESLVTKDLKYVGSKYPVASIVRSRKYIERGWSINAGQYLKMILQCGALNLNDPTVLEEQLTGVDLSLFKTVIEAIKDKKKQDSDFTVSLEWVSEVIDKVFDEEELDQYIHSTDEEVFE